MQFSDEQRRLVGVASIVSICVVVLAAQLQSVVVTVTAGGNPFTAALEVGPTGLLTIGVIAAAFWFWVDDWPADRVVHIARWTVVAVVIAVALESWVIGVHVFLQDQTASYVTVTNTVLLGLVAGGAAGLYSARQREGQRELTMSEQRYRSLTEDVLDSSDVGLFILDAEFDVVWINEATEQYFDLDRDEVIGCDARTLVEERLKHRFAQPDRFAGQVTAGYDDNTGEAEFECRVADGDEDRWLAHFSQPIESGLYRGGRIEHYTDITERKRTNDRLEARERTLRRLHDVLLDRSTPLDDRIDDLLDIGREMLDVEHAVFTQVAGDEMLVEAVQSELGSDVQAGYAVALDGTYAERIVEQDELQYASNVSEEWPGFTDSWSYEELGLEYYVGVPVRVDDDLHGVLAFGDPSPREETAGWQLALLDIMANSLAHELEHRLHDRRREQQLQETREEFESLVEDVEDYAIFRLSPEGHVESWNRGAEDIKGYTEEEILGEHVRSFHTTEDRAAGRPETLLNRAAEEGRAVDEGWRVRKDGSRFWANVVVTALRDDEDDDVRGFLKVTRDMTERREREQKVEHERERLEFMNRIIRHNLLNGMNVVEARAGMLEGHVDDQMAGHLDTIQTRIRDMIDLIETMRAFMRAIVEGKEHDPEPTDLAPILESEVAKAVDAYDHARVEAEDFPDVAVLADDLLPEVFENLLTNAVQHNDRETPVVEVRTEVTDERVSVVVSDNGPGIDEELRDAVFEKGRKGFDSPGTGFGLYLVREIVDSYGGRVDAENGPDGGAVFTVHLPRVD
ncbi:PAS domain S-box protein [Haloarchaeobius amylolyticus]|uniref:PAS domain S-box protein n=1 Tax=Haloarchaeobius amylolyticus TaxID=1198296 RepID=UPI00226D5270|nr:PAS domain S-box protein [Haloarchaeobius amylolyticus]